MGASVELQGDYVEKLKKISEKVSCIFVRLKTFQTTLVHSSTEVELVYINAVICSHLVRNAVVIIKLFNEFVIFFLQIERLSRD